MSGTSSARRRAAGSDRIAAGEPVDRNDDLFGSTVNLASRICQAADPGQTLVSDVVHDLGTKEGFRFFEGGLYAEGLSGPDAVFELDRGAVPDYSSVRSRE